LSEQALVSIGMPVYNGERFLRQALQSLLAQDHSHFELIISDNGSQDRSEEICREFIARDSRIRYVRHAENRGARWNFNYVLRQGRAKYFLWAACDDLWHPTFIGKCVAMLEAHADAVLCCTELNFIDGADHPTDHYPNYCNLETLGMTCVERIRKIISLPGWFATLGVMRNDRIPDVPPGTSAFGWDVAHLLELSLLGPFVKVPESLFSFRIVGDANSSSLPALPYTGLVTDILRVVYRSTLSSREKAEVFADCILAFQGFPWRVSITEELIGSGAQLNDSQYALLLGMILNSCVPCDEIKQNPLSAAVYRSVVEMPDLVQAARKVLSRTAPSLSYEQKVNLAARQFELGHLQEAARLFEETLAERQTSNGWSDWATVQMALDRADAAEQGLRGALRLDENNAQAEAKLGILVASLGRADESIPYLERSIPGMVGEERVAVEKLLNECRRKLLPSRAT
jgi:glycosyltransferase involved in cell wall biosynthesis